MHGVFDRVLLRHLLEEAAGSRLKAAQRVGVGRTTLYRWIKAGLLDEPIDAIQARYTPRPPQPTKLEPFKALIQSRLDEYPELTAVRLFAECRAAGYTGGIARLRSYVRALRPVPAPVDRFETPPGHQAQADFAHCRFPWGVRYALVVVLSYSRLLWVQFYPRQDLATLIHGLETCFHWWGGVVYEMLFDQMRAVVTRDERLGGGALSRNFEFLRFVRHYGVRIRVCRPIGRRPRGRSSDRSATCASFLYGRTFLSDADLNAQVLEWLEMVANRRVHATTHAVPAERFRSEERPALHALPARPYRSLVLPTSASGRASRERLSVPPVVVVERRSLETYASLAALGTEP